MIIIFKIIRKCFIIGLLLIESQTSFGQQEITRIWLSYNATEPQNIVINWYSAEPGNSEAELMFDDNSRIVVKLDENVQIHHVEVPLVHEQVKYRYKVKTNNQTSEWHSFRGITSEEPVRIAVIADWAFAVDADISVILDENPALIVTGGDNIQGLFLCGENGDNKSIESYLRLVDSFPDLFQTVPFMPALGNHDKQLYPRGKKAPEGYDLYDTNAVAFRNFFELPGREWMWALNVPHTNLRLLVLDLNHIRDHGTTWQACHSFGPGSEQFIWYKYEVECNPCKQIVTIYNGENMTVRKMAGGIWKPLTQNSDIIISGSGYFAEYTIIGKTPYLNSSLVAGDLWPDPLAEYSRSEASYIMIIAHRESAKVIMKRLNDGKELYETILQGK